MNTSGGTRDKKKFSAWLEELKSTAVKQSAWEPLIGECLESIRFNPDVIEKYNHLAEFTRSMGEYVGIGAFEARAETGRGKLAGNRETLSEIEDLYGVDATSDCNLDTLWQDHASEPATPPLFMISCSCMRP